MKPACLYIAWGVCLFCFFIFPRLNLETRGSAQVDGEHILQCEKAIITWGLGLIFFFIFFHSFSKFQVESLFWLPLDLRSYGIMYVWNAVVGVGYLQVQCNVPYIEHMRLSSYDKSSIEDEIE